MKNVYKVGLLFLFMSVLCFTSETIIYGQSVGGALVQTNSATNISNYQSTLNGYLTIPYISNPNYVYFQWGTTTNYGNQTPQLTLNNSGSFSQNISGLSQNTTYHFRAVAQVGYTTIYGQDMAFNSSGYYLGFIPSANALAVNKKVINLTSGNLNWSTSVIAKPFDILTFAITMQANNQDVHNVTVNDALPANLIYKGNLMVNASLNYGGNPTTGINLGTISANGAAVISYQVQVAPPTNFVYGTTALANIATVNSQEAGSQTSSATVNVNNSVVQGATTVSTGLTNNILADSFLLPLLIIIVCIWLYISGTAYMLTDKLKARLK